ncbi:unnamed protein product [Paramecium octaurelia]|uniref:Uncharacterized protein n=1 Tax=Paramecium octaurelia TaxID=43137 RepID=A0A8S1VM34_PAROT|nr:unnamed protein product [Paramecium octaurelia]
MLQFFQLTVRIKRFPCALRDQNYTRQFIQMNNSNRQVELMDLGDYQV